MKIIESISRITTESSSTQNKLFGELRGTLKNKPIWIRELDLLMSSLRDEDEEFFKDAVLPYAISSLNRMSGVEAEAPSGNKKHKILIRNKDNEDAFEGAIYVAMSGNVTYSASSIFGLLDRLEKKAIENSGKPDMYAERGSVILIPSESGRAENIYRLARNTPDRAKLTKEEQGWVKEFFTRA